MRVRLMVGGKVLGLGFNLYIREGVEARRQTDNPYKRSQKTYTAQAVVESIYKGG